MSQRSASAALVLLVFALLVGQMLFSPPLCASAGSPTQAGIGFVLTTRSVLRADLRAGRITLARALPSPGRKIVRTDRHALIQQADAIQIFDAKTLTARHSVRLPGEISDIATSGSLLYAAEGRRVHVFCVLPDGEVAPPRSIMLPKQIDPLAASGRLLYALDDVVEPLYAHVIDITRPGPPRVETATWDSLEAGLIAQAVADRWYVMITDVRYGLYLAVLPARPPLGEVTERNMLTIVEAGGTQGRTVSGEFAHEFQVYEGIFYGLDGFTNVRLFQRPVDSKQPVIRCNPPCTILQRPVITQQAGITEVADLGHVSQHTRKGIIELEGSTLYVAGDTTLYGFELRKESRPVAVLRIDTGAPIVSFAAGVHVP